MLTLEAFENKLESKKKFSSNHKEGGTYSSQELISRLETVINELEKGEISANEAVRYFPRGQLRKAFKEVLKTEWFDVVSERFAYKLDKDDFYLEHKPSKQNTTLPYQGYKLRITAELQEAREIAEAVLEPLRQMGEFHKVVPNVEKLGSMRGDSQEGKFITVYPELSEKGVIMEGKQRFKKVSPNEEPPKLNKASVNANYESTKAVIKSIEKALKRSSVSLRGGSIPPTDVRYKNTRISYRYGAVMPFEKTSHGRECTAAFLDGGTPSGKLVDVNGNLVKDNRSEGGADNWRSLNGRKELK